MLSNNRYKSQRRDLIQTQGSDDILVSGGLGGTTGKYMLAAKPGLITQRQTGARYSEEQVLNGLIGWWFLAEPLGTGTYYDFSGSDATVAVSSGIVATEYTGVYGIVTRIDVLGGTLAVSGTTAVGKFAPLTNASWTIATWVRFDTTFGAGNGAIAEFNENLTETGKAFSIYRDTSTGVITYALNFTLTTISTTTVPVVGRWYHLALSYEYSPTLGTGTYRIYLDGTLENTLASALPFAGNLANTGSAIRLGYILASSIWLGGALNDFRVYRRALSTTEVGYLVGLRYGRLASGLAAFGGNTTQTTRWQSGPINTNQLGQFVSEIGQSADGAPFQQTGQPVQPAAYALRGHWPLTADNAFFLADISGNQASATFSGTSAGTQIANPEIGTMLALNGTTDYVDMSSSASKMSFVNSGSFTVCMWVKLNNETSSSSDPLFEIGTSTAPTATGSHIYAFRSVSVNTITFTFFNNQLNSSVTLDSSLSHLAFTYNRSARTRQIWINGQLAGQDTNVNPPLLTSLTRIRLGFNTYPSSLYLSGVVADFRIYSTALTATEIIQIMRQRLTLPGLERRGLLGASRLIMPLTDAQTVGSSLSNIHDFSGYGHLGTVTSTQQILSVGAKTGLSFVSAGSQRITIPTTTALSITGALSIAFWIYPTSLASQFMVISKQNYAEYEIAVNTDGRIQFSHGSGTLATNTTYTTVNQIITAVNQWYYIVVTRETGALNGKNVHIWANGIYNSLTRVGTNETTYTVGSASANVFIGSTPSGTGYANMILSGLELSAVCWTPNEIRGRMLLTQPQSYPISSSSLASISANPGDSLALHLNAKDAVTILGASPQYLPDYSGYGHTANVKPVAGAVSFSSAATIPGGAARSLSFNGSTGYLICDGGAAGREYLGPAGGTARTISMWVYPMSIGSTNQPLISWGSALANTTAGGSFDAYLNTGGNLVVALNSQADLQITQTWDTRLGTGSWRQISLVVDPTAQPAEMIKCYTANATLSPSAANLVVETSNTTPNQLVCLLDLAEETPTGRLTDSSGYDNHASYMGQWWTSAGTFTYARIAHKQYELNGTIYIVGGVRSPGVYTSQVETFNGTTWAIGTALPQERAFHGGAVYNSAMYAIGGRITASGTATSTVITSTGGSWSSTTSLSGIRVECAAAVLGDYLYAIGGFTTGTGTTYLSSVERFNGSTWTTTTSMNTARASPSIAVLNGYIYVMGGYNSTDLQLRTVERFDGSTWTLIQPMNYARNAASAIVQGNYIYVIGGATTGGTTVNSVERFDGRCWTVIGTFPQSLSYAAAGIYSAGNYLLHTGGSPTGVGSTSINTSYRAIKSVGLWGEPVTWMNGIESNIVIPASTTTNLAANSAHTVSLWVQPSITTSGTLFSAENTSSQDLCAVRINASGRVVYTMTNAGAATNTVSSNSALTANSWVHITTTYDGSNMRLFLDGTLTNTTASSGTTATGTPRDIYIGADFNTAAKDYFSGNLGECRVYRTALTTNSVGALYSIGTQGINRSLVRTQPSAQLTIGRGFTGSQQATNFYSGYMDDIRVYDGLALSYPDLVSIWSNGSGNYYTGTGWRQHDPIAIGSNSAGVVLSSAPIPRQMAIQTYYTATYTPGTGGLSYKGPGQEFPSGTFDLSGKILTYTPNTTATGYTWTVATGTNWTTTPPGTYSAYSNTSITADDSPTTVSLLNSFRFYGTNYSTIYVSPNGYFSTTSSTGLDGTYSGLYNIAQIAGARRDLFTNSGGSTYFGYANSSPSTPNDTFIGTWAATASYNDPSTRSSFQIVIYLNNAPASLAGNIIVNYGSVGTTGAQIVAGISNGGGETAYIGDGRGVDLSAGAPVSPDVYTLTAATSNLATRPSNITPATLLSQSLTCSNLVITNPLVQPYNLASNLAGWWQLNDLPASGTSNTLVDSSGLGHTANKTGPGQALWLVSPQNHPAIYLNGTQQNITIKDGSTTSFPVSGSDYSISGWFNCFSNTAGANNAIIGISTNADADRLVVYSAPDSNIIISTSAANTTCLIPTTGNAWNHLVITGTATDALGSNTRIYLNNYQIANTAATTTFASNDKFYLGSKRTSASGGTSTNYFTGLLSDFRIYNRRLQPTEIGQLYWGGNHGVIQTDAGSGVYSLACGGVPGIGSSTNSRLIKLVSPGFAQPPATPREPQEGSLGISVRVKLNAAQPSIATLASSETAGSAGSWQLLAAPPQLQALKLWFALNDGVGATIAYNGAHTSPAYNATYTGTGFIWQLASPYVGVAPVFNGTTNYVLVDNGTGLNADAIVGADITICGWVNTNSSGAGTRTVFGISASGTGATVLGLQLVGSGNTLTAVVGSQTVSAAGQAPLNTWCFVALTIRAGIYVTLYLNNGGRAIGTPPAPYASDYFTATLTTPLAVGDTNMIYIGAQPGSPSTTNYFSGGLCDIRVYNRALEPSEIESCYYNRMLPYFIMNTSTATPKVLAMGKTSLEPDKWHHIAVNYLVSGRSGQLGCAEIWVNGAMAGDGNLADLGSLPSTSAGLAANTTANIIIGSSILSGGENARSYLNGRIDDLRISRQPFESGMIQAIASGWQDCILAIGAVGLSGTANNSALAIGSGSGSTTTTSAANGINGVGVLVDTSSGYAAERRDYSNQISSAGGVQVQEDRQLGTQLIFNGVTSYCAVSGYLAQAYHRIFAISCWITPDATQMTGTDTQIIAKWTGATDGSSCYKLAYDFTTNTIIGSVGIGSRTVSVSAQCIRALTHIIMQTTQAELILYINGTVAGVAQLAATAGASGIINVSNNVAVRIGCGSYGAAGSFFKGSISGLRVFETVLALATISDLARGRIAGGSAQTSRMPQIGYDSSRWPQINSGLVFWLSNPQLDSSGANIATIAGTTLPQIRMSENSVYRARGVASNCVVLSGNTGVGSVGVSSLGSGIQTLGSANSNLIFDGSDVLAQLNGGQTFSVAFWGKFYNSTPSSNETVLSLRDTSATTANTMIEIVRASGSKAVSMNFGTGTTTETSNTLVVADTNWHHWVITYGANSSVSNSSAASSKRNYYLDGVRVGVSSTANIGRPMLSNCGVLALGTDYYTGGTAANIGIQDFRIYNRVLGIDEVGLLYNMPQANSVVAGVSNSSVGGSTPLELLPVSGGSSGYEIIGMRKRLVSPNGIPVSGVSGDVAAGDIIDVVGAGSGPARDSLVCAVGASPSSVNSIADQNWQVKPAANYRSLGYLSNVTGLVPSVASNLVLSGGATSNTILGVTGSPAEILLGNSAGSVYLGTANLVVERRDWTMCFAVAAAGSTFSNAALMTIQGATPSSTNRSWWVNSSNAGELMFQVNFTGTANGTGVFLPADGRWTHLAITKGQLVDGLAETANTMSIYQDGVCRWQRVVDLNPSGEQFITLGATGSVLSGVGFTGRLRDIQVYNSCLGAGQLRNLAQPGNQLMCVSSPSRPSGAPLHHWLFAVATSANTVPDLGVLGSALGLSASGVSIQYRTQGNSLETWSRVSGPGLPSDAVAYFNGSGEAVAYSCPVSRDAARTVTFWMRRSAIGVSDEGLLTWGTGSVSGGWMNIGLNSTGQISVRTSSTMTPRVVSTTTITDNRWYHVCVVCLPPGNSQVGGVGTADNIRVFINGYHDTLAPFGSGFAANPLNTVKSSSSSSDWLYIGSAGLTSYFSGWMDDVRIYGYALTPEEVLGLARGAGQLAVVRV